MSKPKKSPKALLDLLAELSGSQDVIPRNKIDAEMMAEAEGGRDPGPPEPRHEFEHCDATGKVCYPSHNVARQIMRRRQQHGAQRLRVYQCNSCHKYHLTSYA
jgi:hypothetical protein